MSLKILTVVGARPQFIKLAPVSRAFLKSGIRDCIVHTGQHYDPDLSDIFFDELGIPAPAFNLKVGSGSHGLQTSEILRKIEEILIAEKPDWMMVYGDTNSTVAAALAASKLHIPVAHVEAGLRSFNRRMPEEINRVITDHISGILFCPTKTAVDNLAREGITQGVHLVGDVMLDALLEAAERAKLRSTILEQLRLVEKHYLLVTIHRAENTNDPERLRAIMTALGRLAEQEPVIVPIHPRTRKVLDGLGYDTTLRSGPGTVYSALHAPCLISPLGYLDFVRLSSSARVILTDSGGLQKEACWLGVPCVTLRDETEWVETVEHGWNIVVGANTEKIIECTRGFTVPTKRDYAPLPGRAASAEIAQVILKNEVTR